MGRNKLKIQKLETSTNRQVTYSKRRMGIMKKARELSVLCDVDVLLVIFSTAGRPTLCMGEKSKFEEVIGRYASLSPQERNKKRLESLEALRKTFKNADHVVDLEQLKNQGSEPVEEIKQRIRSYKEQINETLLDLGPLAELRNIDNISDINTIIEMEKRIIRAITQTRVQKEHFSANLAKVSFPFEHGLNQLSQLNETPGSFWFTAEDGQRFTHPSNLQLPPSDYNGNRDFTKFNMEYNAPTNFSEQFMTWPQMGGTHETVLNVPIDSMPQNEKSLCFENGKMDSMILDSKIDNKGWVNENWSTNRNQFACQGQDELFNCDIFNELGEQQLSEISNGSSDIVSTFIDNASFSDDNVNPMHDSNFHNWTSAKDGGCF